MEAKAIGEIETQITGQQIDQIIASQVEAQVQKVKGLGATLESKTQELHLLQVEFNQKHADLIESKCKAQSDCDAEEAKLRELTLKAFEVTGSKKPAPGVGIRVVKALQYDETKALHWCVSNQYLNCLSLNKTNFKKVAEGLGPDFVEIKEVPTATIAKEL